MYIHIHALGDGHRDEGKLSTRDLCVTAGAEEEFS